MTSHFTALSINPLLSKLKTCNAELQLPLPFGKVKGEKVLVGFARSFEAKVGMKMGKRTNILDQIRKGMTWKTPQFLKELYQ